jgi:hypothetical protein
MSDEKPSLLSPEAMGKLLSIRMAGTAPTPERAAAIQAVHDAVDRVNPAPARVWRAIDAALDLTPHIPALKAAGVTHVLRYVWDHQFPSGKIMQRPEADALRAAGFHLIAIGEGGARMMDGGHAAAADVVGHVERGLAMVGMPGAFVYLANDTDTIVPSVVCSFLDGASALMGLDRVGLYGGYAWVKAAFEGRHARRVWQAIAWSHEHRLATAALFQHGRLPGLHFDHDQNDILDPDGQIGQRV